MVLVTRVVDGDTIQVDYRGTTADVRLIGVDTPETVHPSEPVGCFGPVVSRFTTATLTRETVRLEFDVERRDHYGRLLAYVWDKASYSTARLFGGASRPCPRTRRTSATPPSSYDCNEMPGEPTEVFGPRTPATGSRKAVARTFEVKLWAAG